MLNNRTFFYPKTKSVKQREFIEKLVNIWMLDLGDNNLYNLENLYRY